jgi:peptide/nickel transport system substrate-binding protein
MLDDAARYKAYQIMDSMIMEEAAVVILFYDEVLRFVSKEVKDLGSNPINLLDLTRVDKK